MTKTFTVAGETLYIDQARLNYNVVRKQFIKIAEKAKEKFINAYTTHNKSLEDVYHEAFSQGNDAIAYTINEAVAQLIEQGILTISNERFIEQFTQTSYYGDWTNAIDDISEQYLEIVEDQKAIDAYRAERKQARGRVVGGGFGLGGFVKGAVTAGAINAVTGAAHRVGNAVGKGTSTMKATGDMRKIFNDPQTLAHLAHTVFETCCAVHLVYLDFLTDEVKTKEYRAVTLAESDRAKSLFNNLQHPSFPEDKKLSTFIEVITLNPYASIFYTYIFNHYPENIGQINQIANFFSVNISEYKMKQLDDLYQTFTITSEEEAHRVRGQLVEKCNQLNFTLKNEVIHSIDNTIADYDRTFRTVNHIEFKTRNEAILARQELKDIDKIFKTRKRDSEEEVGALIKEIKNAFQTEIRNEYLNKLDKEKKLYFNNKVKLAEQFFAKLPANTEAEALVAKEKLVAYMREIKLHKNNKVLEKLNKKINKFDLQARTFEGVVFQSRDLIPLAQEESLRFNQIITQTNMQSTGAISQSIDQIKSIGKTALKDKYIKQLETKLKQIKFKDGFNDAYHQAVDKGKEALDASTQTLKKWGRHLFKK